MEPTSKHCSRCRRDRPVSDFGPHASYKDGLYCWCRECVNTYSRAYHKRKPEVARGAARKYALRSKYGLTLAQYDQMLAAQSGGCATCGAPEADSRGGLLHVDHCHVTGRVRSLLCSRCNTVLGRCEEDADLLRRLADYLAAT